jgi:recombination protein RecA
MSKKSDKKTTKSKAVKKKATHKKKGAANKKKEETKNTEEKKAPNLDAVLATIVKQYGKGAVALYGSEASKDASVEVVPTGSMKLDRALGCGGIPQGRIIEIYGPEASGKTFLSQKILAQFLAHDPRPGAFIDVEHAIDPDWAKRGPAKLDMGRVLFSQPMTAEEGLNIAENLAASGGVSAIVIDSISALTPKAELEGNIGDSHVGLQARLVGQAMRKLNGICATANTTLILINQLRMKIGTLWGSPETTSGGNAPKFFSSMRFRTARRKTIGEDSEPIGWKMEVNIKKNKCSVPHQRPELSVLHDRGFWMEKEMIQVGIDLGLIKKAGAWLSVPDNYPNEEFRGLSLGQGEDAAANILEVHSVLRDDLRVRILAA